MNMTQYKNSAYIYLFLISFLGMAGFFIIDRFSLNFIHEGLNIACLSLSILLLNHYMIELPPKGNYLSMDSSLFLASLFLFGPEIPLDVLLIFTVFFTFQKRSTIWWKHIFNFAVYTLMIISSYGTFIIMGGVIGKFQVQNIIPYVASLSIYFVVNVILIGIAFLLTTSEGLGSVLRGLFKGTVTTYLNTLLLSLVLVILLGSQQVFGLILFTSIAILLSLTFKQHFRLYKDVAEKANKDYLTGLNNHGYFRELLIKEVNEAKETEQPLTVAILDIDDFKKYNDMYGHIQGDLLLKDFGRLLRDESEARNFTVSRYGGEEFTIILPNTTRREAFQFLNDLRKKANDTYYEGVEGLPYGCFSFSAGIAECERETYNISELINKADQAMYAAKDQGKNLVKIFNEHTEYSAQKSLNLEKDLADAEQQLKIFLSKDIYTYSHSKRVYQYAVDFSKRLNLTDHERKILILGALVHDIGKLEIPRDIINKKGKLDPHEWEIMKKHVTWGKEIISTNKKFEELVPLVELHHERFDGNGYPYGLKGKTIPKLSRILCVVDSFDAMTTERPYQKTKTFKEAIEELRACSGKQFDPQFVEPFIEFIQQLDSENSEPKGEVFSFY
jgi:diguanylate cyclase (GGDEF)-like protein/putative nucleotidyltransferase with HDIG domain